MGKESNEEGKNTKFCRVLAFFHDDLYVQRIDNDQKTNVLYQTENQKKKKNW